ncbi:MAG: succinate dehydrogenase, hydrophobic membrane anchor protein [Methylobacteriaceae bacterium]|jgi:succinate dehydrogenase / fumarate reductase membrane anchor subunit|nr:succinate dehydrogenase, hydrophobic membrane anchor protein [Methylobacteriaceae bacterium]
MHSRRSVALGSGSTGHGVQHHLTMRLTGFLGIFAVGLLTLLVFCLIGKPYAEAVKVISNPFSAAILALNFTVFAWHMQVGFASIVEDYVRIRWLQLGLLLANIVYCTFAWFICMASLVKIVAAGA